MEKSEPRDNNARFFKQVEAGDLELYDHLQESIMMFGFTKAGKTSSCYYLCNVPLKAVLIKGKAGLGPFFAQLLRLPSQNRPRSRVGDLDPQPVSHRQQKKQQQTAPDRPAGLRRQPGLPSGAGQRVFPLPHFLEVLQAQIHPHSGHGVQRPDSRQRNGLKLHQVLQKLQFH